MSPDDITSTTINITKSNISNSLKSSNKEDENNSIENGNNYSNGLMGNEKLQGTSSMDMVLQWGPRKRSRCSRTEARSMVSLMVKPHTSKTASSTRVIKPHGLPYLSSKSRNQVNQMGTKIETPLRNGGGNSRPISRSTVGKRSPSCTEKIDNTNSNKKVSSSIRKVKSDDSLVPNGNGNHIDLAYGAPGSTVVRSPAVGDAEKISEVIVWPRIYLSLSRKEKEDDFYAMKGTKLPHRPKKRAKAADRALQYCYPGLWLSDLTRARYEVRERKSTNKKPKRRGLKGLENMESESE